MSPDMDATSPVPEFGHDSQRGLWIGTSWKMNLTTGEALSYAEEILDLANACQPHLHTFIMPPFTALAAIGPTLARARVMLGAQNMHWESAGSFTGEVSASMLCELGVKLVEIGHAERRRYFGETDETVNRKVRCALDAGLTPLICVGETAPERDAGAAVEAVTRQTLLALAGVGSQTVARCAIAYEPVWAIGATGTPSSPRDASLMARSLRLAIAARFGSEAARGIPILYGGSVAAENAEAYAAEPEIDGLFVGRAALTPQGFLDIVGAASRARSLA
jgi:triosephosphate isomerase